MSGNTHATAIQSRPETFGGKPVIRDTRLKVATVLLHLAESLSVEKTLDEYPLLTAADISACLSYAAAKVDTPPAEKI
ncbi:MAG: DUF433 domain-containing protein [Alphaproteobacteria bacterium]|nr:DUF433 domain-containing protein [Alphaproteobacteria bacterium]